MKTRSLKRGFTLVELLVVISIIGMLIAMLLPAVTAAREAANRNNCMVKIKQLGLGLANFDSAYQRFPLIYNAPTNLPQVGTTPAAYLAKPASTTAASETGWSWIVKILPYIDQPNLYKNIDVGSSQFSITAGSITSIAPLGPFDLHIVNGSATYQHPACVYLSAVICPSWAGDSNTNGTSTVDNVLATEYVSLTTTPPAGATAVSAPTGYTGIPAPTNYKAIAGTHILATASGSTPIHAPCADGALLLSGTQGSTDSSISDGLSNTVMLCETRECGYSSWYDGTLNWVVANNPNATPPGTTSAGAAGGDLPPWQSPSIGINKGFDLTLGVKTTGATGTNDAYLPATLMVAQAAGDMYWGPSSNHSNGAVMHVFGDDHVQPISDQCDGKTYLALTSRAGSESIDTSQIR